MRLEVVRIVQESSDKIISTNIPGFPRLSRTAVSTVTSFSYRSRNKLASAQLTGMGLMILILLAAKFFIDFYLENGITAAHELYVRLPNLTCTQEASGGPLHCCHQITLSASLTVHFISARQLTGPFEFSGAEMPLIVFINRRPVCVIR